MPTAHEGREAHDAQSLGDALQEEKSKNTALEIALEIEKAKANGFELSLGNKVREHKSLVQSLEAQLRTKDGELRVKDGEL